jgi:uncharacterized protein (UPF0254 family)
MAYLSSGKQGVARGALCVQCNNKYMLRDSDSSHLIQVNRMRIAYEPKRLEGQDIEWLDGRMRCEYAVSVGQARHLHSARMRIGKMQA